MNEIIEFAKRRNTNHPPNNAPYKPINTEKTIIIEYIIINVAIFIGNAALLFFKASVPLIIETTPHPKNKINNKINRASSLFDIMPISIIVTRKITKYANITMEQTKFAIHENL